VGEELTPRGINSWSPRRAGLWHCPCPGPSRAGHLRAPARESSPRLPPSPTRAVARGAAAAALRCGLWLPPARTEGRTPPPAPLLAGGQGLIPHHPNASGCPRGSGRAAGEPPSAPQLLINDSTGASPVCPPSELLRRPRPARPHHPLTPPSVLAAPALRHGDHTAFAPRVCHGTGLQE